MSYNDDNLHPLARVALDACRCFGDDHATRCERMRDALRIVSSLAPDYGEEAFRLMMKTYEVEKEYSRMLQLIRQMQGVIEASVAHAVGYTGTLVCKEEE